MCSRPSPNLLTRSLRNSGLGEAVWGTWAVTKYLAQYVAVFEWAHNLKRVTDDFLRLIMGPFIPVSI